MGSRLDFDKFYKFKDYSIDGPIRVAPLNYEEISQEEREQYYMGQFPNGEPKVFVQVGGRQLCDVIIAGAPSFFLLSDKIVGALKENNITGWNAYPVIIKTESMGEIKNYFAFYIVGKADKADRKNSEKIEVVLPNKSKKIKDKGYYFPLESWEGTDFFHHIGTLGSITVTEKVKLLFESIMATNVEFKKCSEYIWA